MKILLYGGKGWIGSQFVSILQKNNINYKVSDVRVNKLDEVENDIIKYNPTHIISFIGRTHGIIKGKKYTTIDYLEEPGKLKENIEDNLLGPIMLSNLCIKHSIHFTYLGTGCIFNYDKEHEFETKNNGFKEKDDPNFFGSSYSIVKGATDKLMRYNYNNCLNLRIRMPITDFEHNRNFITKITNYKYICSIKNSMTVLPDMLPVILDMMKKKTIGTINLTNPGYISHNEILQMYKDIVDSTFTWKNFSIKEQNKVLKSNRSNNYLDTTKLEKLYPDIPNIKTSIKNILTKYKKITNLNYLHSCKALLVTGGCGFIGSNFINILHKKYPNINIINIDALYYCANIDNIDIEIRNSSNYTFIKGNVASENLVSHILEYYNIDTVIHFAAQTHVQTSFTDAIQYTKDNVFGTHNLLECCRKYGKLNKFIHVSTDEVYGESLFNDNKKTEQSILCPTNPYAATKAGAELIVQSYIHSFKMPIIITRGNNVYGPNQYPEKVIPKFIKQLKNNEKITIQGDGSCVRGFLYVIDTVNAFINILNKGKIGEIYNIGCDENMEYSIIDIAKKIHEICDIKTPFKNSITFIEDRPFNDKRYYISNGKLKDLGWKITTNFDEGLKNIIKQYHK